MANLYRVIDNLISLVENKYEHLKDVYSLTKQQADSIDDLDMDGLTCLIDEKQGRIDAIAKLDSQFEAIVDDIKTIYSVKSLDEIEDESSNIVELKNSISKVTEILHSIIQLENYNREKINSAKDLLEAKMDNIKTGKLAVKQYGGVLSYSDAVFFDSKIK